MPAVRSSDNRPVRRCTTGRSSAGLGARNWLTNGPAGRGSVSILTVPDPSASQVCHAVSPDRPGWAWPGGNSTIMFTGPSATLLMVMCLPKAPHATWPPNDFNAATSSS